MGRSEETVLFEIRDGGGRVFNRVAQPAVVFDKEFGTLYKIGESMDMLSYYGHVCWAYKNSGHQQMADTVEYMTLPYDQAEIDKVFQISGYIKRLYDRIQTDEPRV